MILTCESVCGPDDTFCSENCHRSDLKLCVCVCVCVCVPVCNWDWVMSLCLDQALFCGIVAGDPTSFTKLLTKRASKVTTTVTVCLESALTVGIHYEVYLL